MNLMGTDCTVLYLAGALTALVTLTLSVTITVAWVGSGAVTLTWGALWSPIVAVGTTGTVFSFVPLTAHTAASTGVTLST